MDYTGKYHESAKWFSYYIQIEKTMAAWEKDIQLYDKMASSVILGAMFCIFTHAQWYTSIEWEM